MWTLVVYAVIALGAFAGLAVEWVHIKHSIAAPYVQAQVDADKKAVADAKTATDTANAQAKASQDDVTKCQAANQQLGVNVGIWQKAAQDNEVAAAAQRKAGEAAHQSAVTSIAAYQAIAARAQVAGQTCEQKYAAVDKLLRDAAIAKQKAAK